MCHLLVVVLLLAPVLNRYFACLCRKRPGTYVSIPYFSNAVAVRGGMGKEKTADFLRINKGERSEGDGITPV